MSTAVAPRFSLPPLPEMHSVQVFGQTIRYYDMGDGPTLVLVHGLGADAKVWGFCLEALSQKHRVIAPDLLGFGHSDKPLINYRIATYVEMLDRFFALLGLERPALAGSSLGGWISASFAVAFPERLRKLVLVDAVGLRAGAVESPVDFRPSTLQNMREIMQCIFYNQDLASEDLIELAYTDHLKRNDGPTIISLMETLHSDRERLDHRLDKLKTPTLLLWGDSDRISPVSVGHSYQRLIEGAVLEVIPQCGHIPALEKPQELVRHILQFV